MGEPLSASEAYNFWRRINRRVEAAERLTESDEPIAAAGRLPQCPERSSGEAQFHAVVYVSFEKPSGASCGRIPIEVDFDERLTAQEILDLAMIVAEQIVATAGGASRTRSGERIDDKCEPVEESAHLGSVCYG